MSERETVRGFYRFNARVRSRYLEEILRLPRGGRLKFRGASLSSLSAVFAHPLDGLRFWVEFVPEDRMGKPVVYPAREMSEGALRRGETSFGPGGERAPEGGPLHLNRSPELFASAAPPFTGNATPVHSTHGPRRVRGGLSPRRTAQARTIFGPLGRDLCPLQRAQSGGSRTLPTTCSPL